MKSSPITGLFFLSFWLANAESWKGKMGVYVVRTYANVVGDIAGLPNDILGMLEIPWVVRFTFSLIKTGVSSFTASCE